MQRALVLAGHAPIGAADLGLAPMTAGPGDADSLQDQLRSQEDQLLLKTLQESRSTWTTQPEI